MKEITKEKPELSIQLFETATAWREWLEEHVADLDGVWLMLAKKQSGKQSVTYLEAVEEAMCFGWIDGQVKKLDDSFYIQKFTPRRKNSIWSKINVVKAEGLITAGRMRPTGLAAIETAQQNGRWAAAYDSASTMVMPADFQAALDLNLQAKTFYETLNKTNTYAFCWRILTSANSATRKATIEKCIGMLERGQTFH